MSGRFRDREAFEGFSACRNEAKASFGDDRVFIEKFVESPRHIEIQVLGDAHGNVVYLNERECSIQRRHQKLIEESPSAVLTPELRQRICDTAVRAVVEHWKFGDTPEEIARKLPHLRLARGGLPRPVLHDLAERPAGVLHPDRRPDPEIQRLSVVLGKPGAGCRRSASAKPCPTPGFRSNSPKAETARFAA